MHRPYPPANYLNPPLKRQQTKAVAGRKLKKREERSRRNDETRAAKQRQMQQYSATVALSRRQTTADQERRHRETLSAIQRTWRNASHHSSTHHLVGLESLSMNQRYDYNDS
jgi:hypothetical protein